MELAFYPDRQLMSNDLPFPHEPTTFHFRQAIEYSITMNRAVIDYASRHRETLLYNRYLMGRNQIDRGNRDYWTIHPKLVDEVTRLAKEDPQASSELRPTFRRRGRGISKKYFELFRKPENRDPRGFIVPSDQADFPTATKFVNTFIKNGITVHRTTSDFRVGGTNYPAGSYVFKTAQAFRPHIMDMFEPQDYPNDFLYEGGPPISPYDNAGYTLAFQMGIEFDRILDGFDGPFEKIEGFARPLAGKVAEVKDAAGFLLSHAFNDAVVVTNRLLSNDHDVYWLTEPYTSDGTNYPAGTIYIPVKRSTADILRSMANELGVSFNGIAAPPSGDVLKLYSVRIGLWDRYGGSMPSGWTRWLLEQFEFPFQVVYPQDLDGGNLNKKFDVLIFATGAIPAGKVNMAPRSRSRRRGEPDRESIPEKHRGWLGEITLDKTVPKLIEFLEKGGTVLVIGSSTNLGPLMGVPMTNHIVNGKGEPLLPEVYYIPSSILQVRVNNNHPLAYGMKERVDVFFNNSPLFRLLPEADKKGVTPVAWFDSDKPLRSGWAWGQDRLYGGVAIAEAKVGKGQLYLFGPEVLSRGQSHGTFKFFFNGIYLGGVTSVQLEKKVPRLRSHLLEKNKVKTVHKFLNFIGFFQRNRYLLKMSSTLISILA